MSNEIAANGIRITPQKSFLRLDQPFNNAVRSKRLSAVTNVLLQAGLPGKIARLTAKRILADQRCQTR
jgi:hypothetical protein